MAVRFLIGSIFIGVSVFVALNFSGCSTEIESLSHKCNKKHNNVKCMELATLLEKQGKPEEAKIALTTGCRMGNSKACKLIADRLHAISPGKSLTAYRLACSRGSKESCDIWEKLMDEQLAK